MPVLVVCTNMEQFCRTAFIGSASVMFASVGYCLSVIAALLGLLLPNLHDKPPPIARPAPTRNSSLTPTLSARRRRDQNTTPVITATLSETPIGQPRFNLVVQDTPEVALAVAPHSHLQTTDADPNQSGAIAVVDAPSDLRDTSPRSGRSSTSSSSTLVSSPTHLDFNPPPYCPQSLRSWKRKNSKDKDLSCSSTSDSETKPKVSRVPSFVKAGKLPEPRVGLSKAKSFCIAEKARKSASKVPVPRPRTQPYEAPYFAPRPTSESVLAVPRPQPTRSKTLPPSRRQSLVNTPTSVKFSLSP